MSVRESSVDRVHVLIAGDLCELARELERHCKLRQIVGLLAANL